MSNNQINLGNVQLSAKALKLVQELQANDNDGLNDYINRLSNVATWIGKDLEGFDHACEDDMEAIRSIVAISHAVQLLQTLKVK